LRVALKIRFTVNSGWTAVARQAQPLYVMAQIRASDGASQPIRRRQRARTRALTGGGWRRPGITATGQCCEGAVYRQ
jgi:hypothetical protein